MAISPKKIEKNFALAKEARGHSDFTQHRLGAVLVYKGVPLASCCNSTKTSPVQKKYNRLREDFDVDADSINCNSTHAEMACLLKVRNLDIDFSRASVFVYRELKNGSKALARPCEACRAAMKELGIKDFYYTTEDGYCHERMD